MYRGFSGRQREDQPAATDVDGRELEGVTQERAIGVGVRTVEKDMRTRDHRPGSTTTAVPYARTSVTPGATSFAS